MNNEFGQLNRKKRRVGGGPVTKQTISVVLGSFRFERTNERARIILQDLYSGMN